MKITVVCVGGLKKAYIKEGASDYLKRINRYAASDVAEIKEEPAPVKTPREAVLKKEGERILKRLKPGDYGIALTDDGSSFTSAGLARFISGLMVKGCKRVCFMVGGAYGLHKDVVDASQATMSLSPMTLPHELARLVLLEQIYRAFTIIRGEPYSH